MSTEAPRRSATPPAAVRELAAARPVCLAWENEHALTFEVGKGQDRCFIKWAPAGSPLDLAAEAARMTWAAAYTPVPLVLGHDADGEGSWLVTEALPGHSAVSQRWLADPRTAVTAIGEGLRAMHDALPVTYCPFSWMAQDRIAAAEQAAAAGRLDTSDWAPEHQQLGIEGVLTRVKNIPSDGKLVVCHGDACAPNTLITDNGRWSGHVDLGDLGVADRWADLAIATWSTGWNYGPGWEQLLLDAYGIKPDPERTHYYRLLWELG
ncbi:MAG: aminoglycoside 3'-phosphotransferase [Streptosporangiaceae bacterium]|nr:aminoglycoside 3'-phosphotransferase [Streptosporangiaceae bacterium]